MQGAGRAGPGFRWPNGWVLRLVGEKPTPGFAIARLLARDGSLGRVWHVPKAVAYRSAARLVRLGLITTGGGQLSNLGLARSQPEATPKGDQAARDWLRQPVASAVAAAVDAATGCDHTLALWRHESISASSAFSTTFWPRCRRSSRCGKRERHLWQSRGGREPQRLSRCGQWSLSWTSGWDRAHGR